MTDFFSQIWFSLFETTAAAVILLFGWYFARVLAYNTAEFLKFIFTKNSKNLTGKFLTDLIAGLASRALSMN